MSRSCSRSPSGTTSPTDARRPAWRRSKQRRVRRGRTSSSAICPRATRRWWARGATRSRVGSASGSPSPGRFRQSAHPRARRRHQRHRRPGRTADPRGAAGAHGKDGPTLIIAHRLSTISLADRVVPPRRGGHRGRRDARRAAGRHAAVRGVLAQGDELDAGRPVSDETEVH